MYAAKNLLTTITQIADTNEDLLVRFPSTTSEHGVREADAPDETVEDTDLDFKRYFVFSKRPTGLPVSENQAGKPVEDIVVRFQCWDTNDEDAALSVGVLIAVFLKPPFAMIGGGSILRTRKVNDDWLEEPREDPDAQERWQGVVDIEYTVQYAPGDTGS